MSETVHQVDEVLPVPRLAALGLQHVLVMYAGAVAVPLIMGGVLGLDPAQKTMLINADLFAAGLATLVQAIGLPGVGIRLPVMMGVTFASVAPMIAMGAAVRAAGGTPIHALQLIFGSVIGAGVFAVLVAPLMSRLLRFFPPVVTGTIITVIGISLMKIGIGWFGGGFATMKKPLVGGGLGEVANPSFGALDNLAIGFAVLVAILLIAKFARGFWQNIAVLLGIVFGGVVATLFGKMGFAAVAHASWFDLVTPFQFGAPVFDVSSIITMCVVLIVVMVESTGMFLALGEMTGREIARDDLTRGLRADGIGTILGGIFNTFPYTSFSQNVGLVGVTGVRSRWVAAAGGLILVILGLIPKLAAMVASVPVYVLGGSGLVMFGMVAATGVRILSNVDYKTSRNNLMIVALGIGFGMLTLIAPNFFDHFPAYLRPMLDSGILLTTVVTVVLNAYFNGLGGNEAAREGLAEAARVAEA